MFLRVVHEINARALLPRIKGFVPPQNWALDFSPLALKLSQYRHPGRV